MPYYGFYFDPTYILVIIGAVICLIASAKVNSTFNKYNRVRSMTGMTGAQVAERILQAQGVYGVRVEHIGGNLTDHYDPRTKVVRLSDAVYNSSSVAAIGVAAHECGHAIQDQKEYAPLRIRSACGHAIQDQKEYAPLRIRSAIVPAANFGSKVCWLFIIGGLLLGANQVLINIGILLFSLAVLFQLVTLPVEFNASNRAIAILDQSGILSQEEVKGTKKVLSAAAMTYVASLLRLLILFGNRDRD